MSYDHLIGRGYEIGKTDCFSLIRDFYLSEFNIQIKDYARPENWWDEGLDLYPLLGRDAGFIIRGFDLEEVQYGDVLLIAIGSLVANHSLIYVGNNEMIHHHTNQLSTKGALTSAYMNRILYVGRHKDTPVVPKPREKLFNIGDYIPFTRLEPTDAE